MAEGWGMTLKDGDHDFMPWKFTRQPTDMFKTHYGMVDVMCMPAIEWATDRTWHNG